ncbi:CRISPR-associated endonuclease Cas2 [Sporanaerobacter acetigenes]|uniref:CRISPR-associated endoribonuclease Cas2 n=1 Tax=Sporanaerobacter acetigenes DSM 13106 TaxID=1123281 RepID=A0A1M5YZK1_9FIRM|nr:CRISPR-associated endonuclease Cas2 [Sporanaerobacter acetigenes]SHI17228.1 CRISPR-associated protein, Cas2 family [Sporanaerobacter acetigenes DSM 13106]
MFVILVYDIGEKRVAKVLKTCRKYLYWVQNSVFEGEISEANLTKLKIEVGRIIDYEQDSIIIYSFRTTKYSNVEIMGIKKGGEDNFL